MFRIRRIYDDILDIDRKQISEVLRILREQFHLLSEKDVAAIPDMLRNPLAHRFRAILFVADDLRQEVKGFALMLHAPNLRFCYLDYISASPTQMNRGVGGALYQRVREEALALEVIGIFFECLPDDPRLCRDPKVLKQNIARLRFYERYGARPIMGTAYETPLEPGMPFAPPHRSVHRPGHPGEQIRKGLPSGLHQHGRRFLPGRPGPSP
jgi:GNAT superfamily N-acetyltransferase